MGGEEGYWHVMWKRTILIGAVAVAALVISAGCGNSDSGTQHPAGHSSSASVKAAPSDQDHTDADVSFAQQMIPHHAQAIEMADVTRGRELSPEVAQLAASIMEAQTPEIETMTVHNPRRLLTIG